MFFARSRGYVRGYVRGYYTHGRCRSLKGGLRFDSSVGGERATSFGASEGARSRQLSNSAPRAPDPSPPPARAHSICLPRRFRYVARERHRRRRHDRLPHRPHRRRHERCRKLLCRLPWLPDEVRAQRPRRPHMHTYVSRAAVTPCCSCRHATPGHRPRSPSTHPPTLVSLPQVLSCRRHRAPTAPPRAGRGPLRGASSRCWSPRVLAAGERAAA